MRGQTSGTTLTYEAIAMLRKLGFCLGAAFVFAPVALIAQDYDAQVRGYLSSAASDLVGRGYRLQGNAHTGSINEGESDDFHITLGAGDYVIMGACDEDCDDVDLFLYVGDNEIDSDVAVDDFPTLSVDLTGSGSYRIAVKMFGCNVEPCWYAVGVYRRSGGGAVRGGGAGVFADIPYSGGTPEWDDVVKQIMLERFDNDRSGWIDTAAEIQRISCSVLQCLSNAIESGEYTAGLAITYGFREDLSWVGSAIGFSEGVKASAFGRMLACGLSH